MMDEPVDPIQIVEPKWPAPENIRVISTTRLGGVSSAPYDSLNLALHSGDDKDDVMRNRQLLSEQFHLPSEPVWMNQTHSANVLKLDRHGSQDNSIPDADACMTKVSGEICTVMTADCLPVLFCDTAGEVVAAAHAGWKGLAAGVLANTVSELGVEPDELLVWFGPAIGPEKFQVGGDVYDAFTNRDETFEQAFRVESDGRWLADIYLLAKLELQLLGVVKFYGGEFCTYSDPQRFYSYRRDGVKTGRHAHLIWKA